MNIIAHIENDLPEKFGIPRQSGLVNEIVSTIVFEPDYRNPDALRGLTDYSYIWLLWQFEDINTENGWSPTVRPPRLGGNMRMGVFATRSPNRPNPIGLSSVKILDICDSDRGPLIHVLGADLRNNTPIYDIKPYLPYADSHPDALSGFAGHVSDYHLDVNFPPELASHLPAEKIKAATALLSQDPRPSYQNDPEREYGMCFAGHNIRFKVSDRLLTVTGVTELS